MRRAYTSIVLFLMALACGGERLAAAALPEPPVAQKEIEAVIENRRQAQDYFAAGVRQLEHNLSQLGGLEKYQYDPAAPMPEMVDGQSAVVADAGLLFDNAQSALSYIGNVRLNDPRVQLRAARRLYIRLPEKTKTEARAAATPAKAATPSAAAQRPAAQASAPKPAAPTEAPKKESQPMIPGLIVAESAAVDLLDSKFLFEGFAAKPSLTFTRGQDSVTIDREPQGGVAKVFGDHQGDVFFQGSQITFIWHDQEGGEWKLVASEGPVYYHAGRHCLIALGKARLTSPRYTMDSKRALYIVLAPEEAAEASGPFAQFMSMRFKDVESLHAFGEVQLTSAATGGQPASSVRGEALYYAAASGECRVIGDPCSLAFGSNTLVTHGMVELLGNGDALVNGSSITGEYERPFATTPSGGQTIRGSYTAAGPITYDVKTNSIVFPSGFRAVDAHGRFLCKGRVEVYLKAQETPAKPAARERMRLPNLTVARQSDVSRLVARESVRMHSDASADMEAYDLACEILDADVESGAAMLDSKPSGVVMVRYGTHELTAQAEQGDVSRVRLLPNGDIAADGSKISAKIPGENGLTTVTCTQSMLLQREQNILILGPLSRIASPDAILTARAELTAHLTPGDKPSRAPARYPHLSYNFTGLHRATTPRGGTLRTTQASMQCEGAIEIEMKPDAQIQASQDVRQNIRTASAVSHVMVAGKDADGRLLRGEGDSITFDAASGNFYLRGRVVTLVDEFNTHTASGKGACITIDPQNNVHITGEKQITTATKLKAQLDKQKKQK